MKPEKSEKTVVLTVNDVMTERVITTDVNESVKNAAREMAKFGISSLLVRNNFV